MDQDRLRRLVRAVGKEKAVLDLSCEERRLLRRPGRWQKWTGVKVDAAGMAALASSCDEFLVHGVDVEGMKLEIDEELVRRLGSTHIRPYARGASLRERSSCGAGGAAVDVTVGTLDCFGGALRRGGRLAQRAEEPRGVR